MTVGLRAREGCCLEGPTWSDGWIGTMLVVFGVLVNEREQKSGGAAAVINISTYLFNLRDTQC